MRVTLVFPAIGICGFDSKDTYSGEVSWINHGLASIGATLKKNGHDVDLIDMRRLSGFQEYVEKIEKRKPEIVGIGISAMDQKPAAATIELTRKALPETIIVVGGIQPTMFPDKFKNNPDIDHVIIGEGETAMAELCNPDIDHVTVIKGKKEYLDNLPFVDRDLFNYKMELDTPFLLSNQEKPMVTMLAGRGCPYKCAYCQPAENSVFGTPYRIRSVDNVIAELDELQERYSFKSVIFWDDTFTFNQKWIEEFCGKYHHDAEILANSRADIICNNPEMVKNLAGIGLKTMLIGFESGSQKMLDIINKGTTVDQNYEAAEICRKYGVKIFGTFMYGMPHETKTDALLTKAMIMAINPDYKLFFVFTPIPGTTLYDYCKNNDLLLDLDYDDIARTGVYKKRLKGIDYKMLANAVHC